MPSIWEFLSQFWCFSDSETKKTFVSWFFVLDKVFLLILRQNHSLTHEFLS